MEITKDEFGPEYVIRVYDPKIGMEGFLVIDNTTLGPGKGGIRMTSTVTVEEVFRLARTMTWKNSLAEIPFGGAKAGIVWPVPLKPGEKPDQSEETKKKFVQSFARAIKLLTPKKYIAGPDVQTSEREMNWFVEATGDWRTATGKPANLCMSIFGKPGEKCGIPHEFGSTGFGVAKATEVAVSLLKKDLKNLTIAIHGFGNVGTFAYKHLEEQGAKIVAIADHHNSVYKESGFEKNEINKLIGNHQSIGDYPGAKKISSEDFWALDVDILIPASVTDVINENNKHLIKAKIIVEGGNIPMSEKIENELWKKGIIIVPDFVANMGGVISSYAEYRGYNPKRMFELVERKIKKATRTVLEKSLRTKESPRDVAMKIAIERVLRGKRKK
ncbi:MAG: Glu/Leu/Phe/Val dehydrogenase [Candidatus Paceibacterota bacterium]|jgi:glutamate dehydrogenase/leucine dehydrogenase